LLDKSIPVDLQSSDGQTALHLACAERDFGAIDLLLEHGASTSVTVNIGPNALHHAAQGEDASCIGLILGSGTQGQLPALLKTTDNESRNALHDLVTSRAYVDVAAVQCLTTQGVEVNQLDKEGYSPVARYLRRFLDRSSHKAEVAEYLFQAYADPSFQSVGGLSLGHLSAHGDELDIELLQVLAMNAVDLRLPDHDGRTILHHCAAAGSLETRRALSFLCNEIGLALDSHDNNGKTTLDLAIEAREQERRSTMFRAKQWSTTEQLLREWQRD
ncbi:hypothetical protein LTR49_028349, partial [Elasticomyces elasticus]